MFRRFRSVGGADLFVRGLPTIGAKRIETVPLMEALTRRWNDDRHVVLYTSNKPYRINNAALGKVRAEVRLVALDVDNHDDTPGWMEGERVKIAAMLEEHPGAFVHTTRGGWRAYYALREPFPVRCEADKEAFALWYARMAAYLFDRYAIVTDDALTRWNQPIRLPHVVRDGRVFDAEILAGAPQALGVFELPEETPAVPDLRALAVVLPRWGAVAKRWEPKREIFRVASSAFDGIPLPPYADCVAAAEKWAREEAPRAVMHQRGRATASSVAATLHVGFALHREDVERILVGPYNRRRCSPPWSETELDDLRGVAQAVPHTPIHVWGFMVTRDRTGIEAARATLAAAAEARDVIALEDVATRVVAAIEQHPAVVVRATYGAGKTHTIARYVATRTTGRVLVVVPTHELARTWLESLSAAGEHDVAYHASVVQRRDESGKRHCDNKLALRVYRHGGDVARDVCPSCPRAATCPACNACPREAARVHVLPRELLETVDISDEDMVVFDDAAVDLLAWHRLRTRQLRRLAAADERILPSEQTAALRIFLHALLAGPREAEERARAALGAASADLQEGEALRHVAARLVDGQRSPRLPPEILAEGGDELVETLLDVARIRQVLRFAAAYAEEGAEVRWLEDWRTVHGESVAARLLRTHGGRLVVLDGAANVEELRVLRPDLHVERLDVDDAGEVERVLLFAKGATRSALREDRARRKLLDAWLGAVLERLTARRCKRVVLVGYKALRTELRTHPALVAWCAADARRKVRVAHYGATRGSNRFRRCDAVVSLGDPWLNGDDTVGRAEWLGIDEPSYRVALATAELGQAHGRSRSVRRRRRLTHVHVGRLVPDGWATGVVVEPQGGPPAREHGRAERIEFRALVGALGGNRAAAALLGCSSSAVAGWLGGRRGLPREILQRARALAASRDKRTASSAEEGRRSGAGGEPMDALPYGDQPKGCVHSPGAGDGARGSEETVLTVRALQGPQGLAVGDLSPVPEQNDLSPSPSGPRCQGVSVARGAPIEGPPERSAPVFAVVSVRDRPLALSCLALVRSESLPGGAAPGAPPSGASGVPASAVVGDAELSQRALNAAFARRILEVLRQPLRASPPSDSPSPALPLTDEEFRRRRAEQLAVVEAWAREHDDTG